MVREDVNNVPLKTFRKASPLRFTFWVTLAAAVFSIVSCSIAQGAVLPEMLAALFPCGSITGAPKPSTLKIIHDVEGYERGYYTGVMGYFDGENFESAVMIRYIENQLGNLIFKSGGGITALSNAENEYQEIIDKVYLPISHVTQPLH